MPFKMCEPPFPANGQALQTTAPGAGQPTDLCERYRRIGIAAVAAAALHREARPERARPAVADFMD